MRRRTTLEIDEQLLTRAKRALGCTTMRATVEEALRRAADDVADADEERAQRQRDYFEGLPGHADLEVLDSERMWR